MARSTAEDDATERIMLWVSRLIYPLATSLLG
jgi:hypothetical protein